MGEGNGKIEIGNVETVGCSKPAYMDIDENPWSLQLSFNVKASTSLNYIGNGNSPVQDMFDTLKHAEITNARGLSDIRIPRMVDIDQSGDVPDPEDNGLHCKLVDDVTLAPSGDWHVNVNGRADAAIRVDASGPNADPGSRFETETQIGARISGSFAMYGPKAMEQMKDQADRDNPGDTPEPITVELNLDFSKSHGEVIQHEAPQPREKTADTPENRTQKVSDTQDLKAKLTEIHSQLGSIEDELRRLEDRTGTEIADTNHIIMQLNAINDAPSKLEPETIADYLEIDPDEPLDFDSHSALIEKIAMMSRLTPLEYEKAQEYLDGGSLEDRLQPDTAATRDVPRPPEQPPPEFMPG